MGVDEASHVRQGEELDKQSLSRYLNQNLALKGELEVLQFPSGFSNLTYLIKCDGKEFVLRRPPFGANVKSGHDMLREYRFIMALSKPFGRVPKGLIACEDESVIGAPFYLMERVKGTILRSNISSDRIPDKTQMGRIANSTIETLAHLHQTDLQSSGLIEMGRPDGYVERQVNGWIKRFERVTVEAEYSSDELINWLRQNQPTQYGSAILHNDFKYDNLVLDPTDLSRIVAVLDWEMAAIGDPLMDVGTTLGYWVEPGDSELIKKLALSPTYWPGNPDRIQIAEMYAELTGAKLDDIVFYYAFGVFKIAVIVQQIYYRFKKGHTSDPRFAGLNHVVGAFIEQANTAIDHQRISALG